MNKFSKLIVFCLTFLASAVFAQAPHRISQVLVRGNNVAANVSPYAKIQVCVVDTECNTAADVFADPGLTIPLTLPLTADASGNYDYYIASGCVDEQVSAPGQGQKMSYNVCPSGQGGGGGGNVLNGPQTRIAGYQTTSATVGPSLATQNYISPLVQGQVNSDLFQTGGGNNGLANLTSGFCTTGHCEIQFPPNSLSTELPSWYSSFLASISMSDGTQVRDARFGSQINSYINPTLPAQSWSIFPQTGRLDIINYTKPYAYQFPGFTGTYTKVLAAFGGNNYFTSTGPFKTTYEGETTTVQWLTMGQHIAKDINMDCFAEGDCIGPQNHFRIAGGCGDDSDECAHKGADYFLADTSVGVTVCASGCTTGSTNISISPAPNAAQNMWIENWTTGKWHPNTDYGANCRINFGQSQGQPLAFVATTGCTFPDSYLTLSTTNYNSSGLQIAVGNVNIPILTSSLPAGYSANTSGYPGSPFACGIADYASGTGDTTGADYYEQTLCTVVNATTINATLRKPHPRNVLIAYGGMAGNDFTSAASAQDGDYNHIPTGSVAQAMHIVYSYGNTLWLGDYAHTVNVADQGGFSDESQVKLMTATVNVVRTGGTSTLTLPALSSAWNLMRPALTGCSDATMNFANNTLQLLQATGTTLTYAQSGSNSTCTGGTLTYDATGFVINPSAQIYNILNTSTQVYDGGNMTLFPNNMPLAASDNLVLVHDSHVLIRGNAGFGGVGYILPKPNNQTQEDGGGDGCLMSQLVGPSVTCFTAIINAGPAYAYAGHGGIKGLPDAYYGGYIGPNTSISPKWDMHLEAGEFGTFKIDPNYWERFAGNCDFRAVNTVFNFNNQASIVWDPCNVVWTWTANQSIGGSLAVSQPVWDSNGAYDFGGTQAAPLGRIRKLGAGNGFLFQEDLGSGLVPAPLNARSMQLPINGYLGFSNSTTGFNPDTYISRFTAGALSVDFGGYGNHEGRVQMADLDLYSSAAAAFATIAPNAIMPTGNLVFTLPGAFPGSTQALTVDTSGNLGYSPIPTVSGFTGTVNTSGTCALTFTNGSLTTVTGTCP